MANSLKKLVDNGLLWCPGERYPEEGDPVSATVISATVPHQKALLRFGIESIDSALPYHATGYGSTHEFFVGLLEPLRYRSAPPLGLLSHIIANTCTSEKTLALWIGKTCWPSPFALQSLDNSILKRSIFVDPPTQQLHLWATEAALRHHNIEVVVSMTRSLSFTTSRRFSLAAARGKGAGIIIRPLRERDTPSTAHTRWLIQAAPAKELLPSWNVTLLYCRGPQPEKTSWIIEEEGTRYRERPLPFLATPSLACNEVLCGQKG